MYFIISQINTWYDPLWGQFYYCMSVLDYFFSTQYAYQNYSRCMCVCVYASALLLPQLLNLEGFHTWWISMLFSTFMYFFTETQGMSKCFKQKFKTGKNEMMSSEESDLEDPNVMVIHPLTWRSEYVSKMFAQIDRYTEARKSAQARRQMKKQVTGHPSDLVHLIYLLGLNWSNCSDNLCEFNQDLQLTMLL